MTPKETIERELMLLCCRRGDEAAFKVLIDSYEPRLFYFIRRLVQTEEDAWDVLQETWLNAFKHLAGLHSAAALSPWLYRIARNAAFRHLRKRNARAAFADVGYISDDAATEETSFSADDAAQIHQALDALSLPQREVLTLFFLEELSLSEISEIVGAPVGTVKSRLHYAKTALREMLNKDALA